MLSCQYMISSIIHKLKGTPVLLLKLNFVNAYDKVNWGFFIEIVIQLKDFVIFGIMGNSLNNGNITKFWNDKINGKMPLCESLLCSLSVKINNVLLKKMLIETFVFPLEEISMEISSVSVILFMQNETNPFNFTFESDVISFPS